MKRTTFQQFDSVYILTTKNVEWRCDSPGVSTDPSGVWSIVATMPSNGHLLIQKDNALVRIPASDVRRVANYDVETVFEKLEDINKKYFKESNER